MNRRKLLAVIVGLFIILLFLIGCGAPDPAQVESPTLTPVQPTPNIYDSAVPDAPTSQMHLIYDDDGSRDGTAALLYLLGRSEMSIEAINISYGEAHPEIYIQYIGRLLDELAIQDIPLGAGQDAPLVGGTPFPDWLRDLSDNFWEIPLLYTDKTYPIQDAPDLIVSTINQNPEPVSIFLSGTFTNLAQALRKDPDIRENIAAVYFMGGAVYAPGNITNLIPDSENHVAEWNVISDPLAAKEVFASGLDLYMIPLDATNQVKHSLEEIQPWRKGDEKADFVAELYEIMFVEYAFEAVEIFDLTAAVIMVRPDFCRFQTLRMDVITDAGSTSGQTIIVSDGEPNMHVCLEPDVSKIKQHLNESFSSNQGPLELPSIDPIAGSWTGSALNDGYEMDVSITINETCQLGKVCGRFEIMPVSCSGILTWVGMEGELYQLQAGNKTAGCGEGRDYLAPQADGTVLYISRGDYGETRGILQSAPQP